MLPDRNNDAEMDPAKTLQASAYYSEYNKRFDLLEQRETKRCRETKIYQSRSNKGAIYNMSLQQSQGKISKREKERILQSLLYWNPANCIVDLYCSFWIFIGTLRSCDAILCERIIFTQNQENILSVSRKNKHFIPGLYTMLKIVIVQALSKLSLVYSMLTN